MSDFGRMFVPMHFGRGCALDTGDLLAARGHKKVLLVYDRGLKNAGIIDPIAETITKAGIAFAAFEDVESDPPESIVNAGGYFARGENVDGVVAIGGGSSIDTAKAINSLINNEPPIAQYYGKTFTMKPGVPLYAIPTTAGTGSEVTFVAVITNAETNTKTGIGGPIAAPTLAIIDPMLTVGLPKKLTAVTGCDAFAHAVEALTGKSQNPISDTLAIDAIRKITKWLPVAFADPNNVDARENLMYASTFAGMAFMNSQVHLGHSFSHVMGTMYHIAHGSACAACLPEVIGLAVKSNPARGEMILEAMGKPSGDDIPGAVTKAIREFFDSVEVGGLKSCGIPESDFEQIAELVLKDGSVRSFPTALTAGDILEIMKKANI